MVCFPQLFHHLFLAFLALVDGNTFLGKAIFALVAKGLFVVSQFELLVRLFAALEIFSFVLWHLFDAFSRFGAEWKETGVYIPSDEL